MQVGTQPLPHVHDVGDDAERLVAVRPDLVRPAGHVPAGGQPRLAVAVQTEQGAERAVLEPANDQLAVRGVFRVATVEAADVGGPPRDAGDADRQAGA